MHARLLIYKFTYDWETLVGQLAAPVSAKATTTKAKTEEKTEEKKTEAKPEQKKQENASLGQNLDTSICANARPMKTQTSAQGTSQ